MLRRRRQDLQADIHGRLRVGRREPRGVSGDELDQSAAASENELDLVLIALRTKTLARLDAAIGRLESGRYGRCLECDADIAEPRLVAVPFATRCHPCERRREDVMVSAGRRLNF